MLTQAFTSAKGGAPSAVSTGDGYAVFQVVDVKAPHAPTFDEYKTHLLTDYRDQQVPQMLSAQLNKLDQRAKELNDLRKAAAEMNVPVKTSDLVGKDGQVPDLGAMSGEGAVAFTLAKGAISNPINTGTQGIVLSVVDKQEPSTEDIAKNFNQTRNTMLNAKREEVFNIYLGTLAQKYQKAGAIRMTARAAAARPAAGQLASSGENRLCRTRGGFLCAQLRMASQRKAHRGEHGMEKERISGVLLHVTSLPSYGGVGDFGPAARAFVDFLRAAKQKVWQVLPLSPTGYGSSPYSALSAFAGNPVLISLEVLAEQGWIAWDRIEGLLGHDGPVDFGAVWEQKLPLIEEAAGIFWIARPRSSAAGFRSSAMTISPGCRITRCIRCCGACSRTRAGTSGRRSTPAARATRCRS